MIIEEHKELLKASAINCDLAESLGVFSVTNPGELPENLSSYGEIGLGLALPWIDYLTGEINYQIRLNTPLTTGTKYLWPKGESQKLGLINDVPYSNAPVLLVEGYKQALACLSVLGPDTEYLILTMAGCYGTSKVDTSGLEDREVYVILDADVRKNPKVWDAAEGIGHQLTSLGCTVRFISAPGTGTQGIDDCLATRKTLGWRKRMLDRLILGASSELPAKPNVTPISAARSANPPEIPVEGQGLFDESGKYQLVSGAHYFLSNMAQFDGYEGPIRLFKDGVYRDFYQAELGHELAMLCGNAYQTAFVQRTWDRIRGELKTRGWYANEFMKEPWLNTPTGMVNLGTGEFRDHDREDYSTVQIGTNYVPDATCPTFDAWLDDMAGDQAPVLLEFFAQMLDPTKPPARHIILEGPPGSGKSTMIRIIQSVLSGQFSGLSPFMSSLTMHQLNEGGFHTVQLAGKLFNAAGELKATEIADITEFKMLTGDDAITANVKNGDHITFRPRALFCFAMNEFPKVKDAEPYFRRIAPFRFENQKGKDNPDSSIEVKIRSEELPGVLNRLIEASQRTAARGHLPSVSEAILHRFQGETNPIVAWYWSEDNPFGEGWHLSADVYNSYKACHIEVGAEYETMISFHKKLDGAIPGIKRDRKEVNGKRGRAVYFPARPGMESPDDDDPTPPPAPPEPDPIPVPPSPMSEEKELEDQHVENVPQVAQQGPVVTFDIEADSILRMWDVDPVTYPRLIGWQVETGEVNTCTNNREAFLADLNAAGTIVGQNVIGYDLLALHNAGLYNLDDVIEGRQLVVDTMILARQIDPPSARMSKAARPYSLRKLAEKHEIPINKDILKQLAKKYDTSGLGLNEYGFTGFGEIPVDHPEYVEYLKDDVIVTRKVLEAECGPNLDKLVDPTYQAKPGTMVDYLRREHRIAAIAAKSRFHGVRVDSALLEERVVNLDSRRAVLLSTLESEYGLPSEGKAPQSTDVGKVAIRAALLDAGMGEEDQLLTDAGAYSFSGDSMQAIIDRNPGNSELHELCELVSELNGQRSVYHTVLDNLKSDGRVHPEIDFSQATGRWSVTKPGMTVLGKRGVNAYEREIFLPDEGCVFINADFAQVDARCVAAHSQDPAYMELFMGERDLHTEVAIAVFGVGDPEHRQLAKAVGHGWNYGGSPQALAASSGAALADVEAFDKAARERFFRVVDWQNEVRAQAVRGELLNNGWGRRLRCEVDRAFTQAPALIGQSCARDIAMESLLRMDRTVRDSFRMFVHDEFVFSVPEDKVEEYRAEIERAMKFEWRGVPFFGEAGKPAKNWMECYDK